MLRHHFERHYFDRIAWLRAAVLGANDGIVSIASLLVGVAVTHLARPQLLLVGVAGLVAGAMSMAAGEFVSVSTQADSERSDLERERRELEADPAHEHAELASIYVKRGLEPALAAQVAGQLMAHDALDAHARDELGLTSARRARPMQAALASAASFAIGGAWPLALAAIAAAGGIIPLLAGGALLSLAVLGGLGARAGGAPIVAGAMRVMLWGAVAMALTGAVGSSFGALT